MPNKQYTKNDPNQKKSSKGKKRSKKSNKKRGGY